MQIPRRLGEAQRNPTRSDNKDLPYMDAECSFVGYGQCLIDLSTI